MIEHLAEQRLLSIVRSRSGSLGYRLSGPLFEALELLDARLVEVLTTGLDATAHSCATLTEPSLLERIGYLDHLPSIPLYAIPHGTAPAAAQDADWVLSPSTCYSTFAHLEGSPDAWELGAFTARGRCHRHEAPDGTPTRMSAFDMRELVLIGDPELVVAHADERFARALDFVRALGGTVQVDVASDIFYGERAEGLRQVQRLRGLKHEATMPWGEDGRLAIGSRNLHRALFTGTFAIGPQDPEPAMQSTCVAFGLERLLLALLAAMPEPDPDALLERLASAPVAV